jgi:hypothetical protein
MTAHNSDRLIRAPLERVRELLLRPLELPDWNPAFLGVGGPAQPVENVPYSLTVRGGLSGRLRYERIDADQVAMVWETAGFHESATWSLEPHGSATLVRHEFDHSGPLAYMLRPAFATVAELRLQRLAERAEGVTTHRGVSRGS